MRQHVGILSSVPFVSSVAYASPVDALTVVVTMLRFGIHTFTRWLLQRRARWPSNLHACTSSAYTERCSAFHRRSADACSRHRHNTDFFTGCRLPSGFATSSVWWCTPSTTAPVHLTCIADTTTRFSPLPGRGRLRSAKTYESNIPCTKPNSERERERERERVRSL